MKTTLIYGLAMAFVGTLLACLLYFMGFHDSVEKLKSAQMIGMVGGIVNSVVFLALGIRARRAEVPASEPFGYGRALGTGTLIALWGSIFGALGHLLYMTVINPEFRDLVVQGELAKMEAKGLSSTQIEQAEGMVRMMTGPVPQAIFALIFGFIFCFIIALIVAAFIRRAESATPAAS
ncbi:MAG TPA: DUF4199 domain-containing protein [Lacunisphaera sp.]|nr:DUF4199 domain-containing protein [Lacunisphaera sp.]